MHTRSYFTVVIQLIVLLWAGPSPAQELIKIIEPGTGYSRLKQWAIEKKLVFENFTKDTLVIRGDFRDTGHKEYSVRLLVRFCAGDDYGGRAFNATLQEFVELDAKAENVQDAFAKERKYIDLLAGKSAEDGRFDGDYKVRRERLDGLKGIAVGRSSEQGSWEVGLFAENRFLVLQTSRSKDDLCR